MKYIDFVIILIPILLAAITFLFYFPLCIISFDIEQSVTYKNVSKNKFKILVFLICISIGLSFLLLIHKKNLFYYISSWIGQFFIVYVYFKKLDINYNVLEKFIRGKNLEFEIQKSNNDLSIEGNYASTKIKESLSEDIKQSTSSIIKSSEGSKESIIVSMKTHSNDVKDVLSEKIKLSTSDIIKTSQESIEVVIESIYSNSANVINDIDKFKSNNGIEFIKPIYNIFREMNKDLFEYHFFNNRLIQTSEDKLLFYNLICNRIKSDRKINLDIRINENKNILYYKKEIALFLNNFFRIKELINDVNVKNEEINSFFSSNFTINEGKIDFNINDFTRNLK